MRQFTDQSSIARSGKLLSTADARSEAVTRDPSKDACPVKTRPPAWRARKLSLFRKFMSRNKKEMLVQSSK